jgi:hypothetical protein
MKTNGLLDILDSDFWILTSSERPKGANNARNHHVTMHRVQTQKLQQNQEQEDQDRAAGDEEILRVLPHTSGTSGNQVDWIQSAHVGA